MHFSKEIKLSLHENLCEEVLAEIWTMIKIHNPVVLVDINPSDLESLNTELASYPIEVVNEARDWYKKTVHTKPLTLGIFMDKCKELERARKVHRNTLDEVMEKRMDVNKRAVSRLELRGIKDPRFTPPYNFDAIRKYDELLSQEERIVRGY